LEINNLQGLSAYTNSPNTTPPADNSALRDKNLEAAKAADLNQESTTAAQKAFEVTITPEAQDKLAAETTEDQNNQNIKPAQETNRILNIVA